MPPLKTFEAWLCSPRPPEAIGTPPGLQNRKQKCVFDPLGPWGPGPLAKRGAPSCGRGHPQPRPQPPAPDTARATASPCCGDFCYTIAPDPSSPGSAPEFVSKGRLHGANRDLQIRCRTHPKNTRGACEAKLKFCRKSSSNGLRSGAKVRSRILAKRLRKDQF